MPGWRILLGMLALLACVATAGAQVPDDIAIGAIRWDAWYEGAPDSKVLEQPEWAHRAPFFARYDEAGRLHLDGDKEYVLHAEVAYARAIGIDYFIFGFYPDTGSWGRDITTHLKLNRALSSYLRLPDRMGVKFALSLNQLFPMSDVEEMANSVATFAAHPDYMRTQTGTVPVYVLAHDGFDWSKFFGSDDKAREAFQTIRRVTRERTGREITFIIMNYVSDKAMDVAKRYGLDMVTTYSSFAPGKGAIESAFDVCTRHGEAQWAKAAAAGVPYAPNITLGWDTRPRLAPAVNPQKKEQGPWCGLPSRDVLQQHFAHAAEFVNKQVVAVPFRTITVYAWNEYTEGGWMAPSVTDADAWLGIQRAAIGRNRKLPAVELTWPDSMTPTACPLRTADKVRSQVAGKCTGQVRTTQAWPCPTGTVSKSDTVRAPSGYESMVWSGGWSVRVCE